MTYCPRMVGVHLDLKYVMPRKDYLMQWIRRLPEFGIDALLIEYEDKFPYERHPFLRHPSAFTPGELKAFLSAVRALGVRPIPLVPSLSHFEYALGHRQLAHLREAPDIPTQICPCNDEAVAFVLDQIREVLAYHREDAFFHLSGDEAWFLGTCPRCKEWVARVGGPVAAWAEHQRKLIALVRDAGKRPICWDDIFWKQPELIREIGLPRDVILHSWDYAMTPAQDLRKNGHSAYGSVDGVHRRVDAYQDAGHDVLAGPCLDWGILYPRHGHCLANTEAWARKAWASDMFGMINTGWSVFHVPLPAKWLHTAATGALMTGACATVDEAWQRQFLAREYGVEVEGLVEALETLGRIWEVTCPGLERPVSPVLYSYMEMVLHYPGGQAERRAQGSYPIDWSTIDFAAMHRRKMHLLRAHPDGEGIRRTAREFVEAYLRASEPLHALADRATAHRDEAALLALFIDMKLLHARVLVRQLEGKSADEALGEALRTERKRLETCLRPFMDDGSIARLCRIWWEPARTVTCQIAPP